MNVVDNTTQYSVFDIGFNQLLSKIEDFGSNVEMPMPSFMQSSYYETNPSALGSGEMVQKITLIDGFLQSSNFISGTSGWRIDGDGNLEANNGIFRGALSGNSFTMGATGFLKAGQTAFKTGDGVFIGYDTTSELDQWGTPVSVNDYSFADGSTEKVGLRFYMSSGTVTIKTITVKLKVDSGTTGDISCNIYLAASNYSPTGSSLGTKTISGISNTTYEEKEFTFSTPVSISDGTDYVAVFNCATSTPAIKMSYSGFVGARGSFRFMYYSGSWNLAAPGYPYPWIRIYSYNAGYKMSVGNTNYGMSYNGVNFQTIGANIVRTTDLGDSYAVVNYYGIEAWESGLKLFTANLYDGIFWRTTKGLSDGWLKLGQIMPFGLGSNDVMTYSGLRIQSGLSNSNDLVIYALDNNAIRIDAGNGSSGYSGGVLVVGGNSQTEIGSSGNKAKIYCSGLSACPLPTVDSALPMLDTISNPKDKTKLKDPSLAHFEFDGKTKKRKYFDIDDMPDELTFINDVGNKDIELIRVIGFLFKTVKELNQEIKTLKNL